MKIDLKQIQNIAGQIPDIIAKGQQAVEVVNSIVDIAHPKNKVNNPTDDCNSIEVIDEKENEEVGKKDN